MGDVVMLAHALRALKEAYPDLRVTVATRPVFRAFFTGLDLGFMDVDIKGVHHSLRGMWRLAADARRLGVDAVADVHGVLRSVMFRTALWLRGVPGGGHREGTRGEKGVYPQGRPRREARQAYRRPLLRRVPETGICVRRSRAGPAALPSQPDGGEDGHLDRLLAVFGTAGENLSHGARAGGGASVGRTL